MADFLKTTVIGGLLVLFPLFGCAYVLIRIAGMLTSFIKPALGFLPQSRFVGVAAVDVASIVILVLICFLVGIIVKASAVEKLNVRAGDVARVIATFGAGTSALLADEETKHKHDGRPSSIPTQ